MNCPCGLTENFDSCCKPIINGIRKAATAEQLMRARYAAYTKVEMDFILDSHDPKTRNNSDIEGSRKWAEKAQWSGLEIIDTINGGESDQKGVVEFKANYSEDGDPKVHHERSQFLKRNDSWFYTKGSILNQTIVNANKVGRNDPCTCGSGKKFKKCCG